SGTSTTHSCLWV
ncbi:anaerobic C4-dicarboxylate transporter DcuB, partial [Vibrio harveyi]